MNYIICLKLSRQDLVKLWSSVLFFFFFLPETTTASCSNHPKSLQKELCGAVITFPGWENSFPRPVSHKASKSFHYSTTMESHTQAICFNYGNHFILFFFKYLQELRATAGQNRMWKPLGRDREMLEEGLACLGGHLSQELGVEEEAGAQKSQEGDQDARGK